MKTYINVITWMDNSTTILLLINKAQIKISKIQFNQIKKYIGLTKVEKEIQIGKEDILYELNNN